MIKLTKSCLSIIGKAELFKVGDKFIADIELMKLNNINLTDIVNGIQTVKNIQYDKQLGCLIGYAEWGYLNGIKIYAQINARWCKKINP
jgi:hypothetical protein